MERIDDGVQQAAETLRTEYPHAIDAAATCALAVRQRGVLHAWVDLMGVANHAPNPERRRACAQLRDGLGAWFSSHGAPSSEPKAILTWLIYEQSPQQLDVLRARMLVLLEDLRARTVH